MIRTHSLADTRVLDKLLWSSGSERLRVILCAAIECANRFSESDVVTKVPQWLLVKLTRFYRVGVETPNKEAKIRYGRCTNTMTKLPTQNRKKKKKENGKILFRPFPVAQKSPPPFAEFSFSFPHRAADATIRESRVALTIAAFPESRKVSQYCFQGVSCVKEEPVLLY